MVYYCEKCGLLFQRMGQIEQCPRCESPCFRPAVPEEQEQMERMLKETIDETLKNRGVI